MANSKKRGRNANAETKRVYEPFGATHTFCDDCWRQHIGQCLSNGRMPISCMAHNCSSALRSLCSSLDNLLRSGTVNFWSNDAVCAATLSSVPNVTAPFGCPLAKCALLQSHGQSLQSLLLSGGINRIARGVSCDNCNNLMEKNNGCDHIVCVCGYEFCWRCGGDWKRHKNCVGQGQINVPLFDLVFVKGPNGRKLAKSPGKFFAECAEFRAFRQPNRRKLFKLMDQIFGNDRPSGRQWAEKYLQVSGFVELCLAKRQISGKKSDDFNAATDRLRFTFRTIPFIAKMDNKMTKRRSAGIWWNKITSKWWRSASTLSK
ncbi:hypothetical protein niasHS_013882 [Heterodera schachtii]|uniref:RBR-type E3 ubiquitin transferase n=1 Tax=Heterodera schachtii TaxID=97005 RepID=A0ABD2IUB3_HETSC